MIVKITHVGDDAWRAENPASKIDHGGPADYFTPAIVSAAPAIGDVVYWEAEHDRAKGELVFGAQSTVEVFNPIG